MSSTALGIPSDQSHADIIRVIHGWLDSKSKKIQQFWIGADWRLWARYDLFTVLEDAFKENYLVNHSMAIWESHDEHEQVDILLEHRDGETNLAIRLQCENVNENCGSFEEFSKQYQKQWTLLDSTLSKNVEEEFGGTKVMLLGFSGEPMGYEEEEPLFGELKPETFKAGEVHAWYVYCDTAKS